LRRSYRPSVSARPEPDEKSPNETLVTGTLAIPEEENAKGTQGGTKKLHNSAQ
jgi:hypothetical protein